MCEKLESLFHQDEPLLEIKRDYLGVMHLKGAGDGFVGSLLCSNINMGEHVDRSFENAEESQTSDEYLIIDEANETQEENCYETLEKENAQKCTLFDNLATSHEDGLVKIEQNISDTQGLSTQCLKKLSVQIDMTSITSVFPSLCSSLYDCKSLSTASSEISSPKIFQKTRPRLLSKNIPLKKSSSETYLKSEVCKDVGVGLQNMGNTCFVNATLQCLTYTPIFSDILLSSSETCLIDGNCITCELTKHIKSCFHGDKKAIKPSYILKMLKGIAQHMRWGRQEDAHEFLRYLMDALHKSFMSGHQKTNSPNESMIQRIFSGELRSQVICEECGHKSDTFDPFLDLCLDVKSSTSIIEALQSFVGHETLEGENSYFCARCLKNVRAKKLFTIHKPPHILTIQLKRYGMSEGKVTRHIDFPRTLNLQPYMSHQAQDKKGLSSDSTERESNVNEQKEEERSENRITCNYNLYAVLVHDGYSTNSGHYYCYIQTKQGIWYCMNDHMVKMSSLKEVLSSEAYLLFYCQDPIVFEMEGPHNKPQFNMVSPASCSNLSLNSSFNTSSKVTCRGGRLQTSPSTTPLTSASATQSEAKPLRSSTLNSSKSFSKALKHRTKGPSRYRLKRLILNKEKLRTARAESKHSSSSQKASCIVSDKNNSEEIKLENEMEASPVESITNNTKHIYNKQPLRQKAQERARPTTNMPESLLEILKPQKVRQTSPEETSKPFKIPLKKSFKPPCEQDVDLAIKAKHVPDAIHNSDPVDQTMKDGTPDVIHRSPIQISKNTPSKTHSALSSTTLLPASPPSKTTIQLRPRKSRSAITSPVEVLSPSMDPASSFSTLTNPTQSPLKTHSTEHDSIEHRKFRKRKQSNSESPSKCLAQTPCPTGRSLRKTRPLLDPNQFVVAPIKLRKVAVTEDGEHLYRIV